MPLDYAAALRVHENLSDTFIPDAILTLPSGQRYVFAGVALHSETLDPMIVMVCPDTGTWHAAAPGAVRKTKETAQQPIALPEFCVFQHKKGGYYTRICDISRRDDPLTLYIAHSDLVWWLRPKAMFDDGRFTADPTLPPISRSDAGL